MTACVHDFRTIELFTSTIEECVHCKMTRAEITSATSAENSNTLYGVNTTTYEQVVAAPLEMTGLKAWLPTNWWNGSQEDVQKHLEKTQTEINKLTNVITKAQEQMGVQKIFVASEKHEWNNSTDDCNKCKLTRLEALKMAQMDADLSEIEKCNPKPEGLNSGMALRFLNGQINEFAKDISDKASKAWTDAMVYGTGILWYSNDGDPNSFPKAEEPMEKNYGGQIVMVDRQKRYITIKLDDDDELKDCNVGQELVFQWDTYFEKGDDNV